MPLVISEPIRQSKKRSAADPLWKGPEKDGITFSLLSRFLVCRERFRLLAIEGLKADEGFNHRLEYGNMWHICEEALAKGDLSQMDLLPYYEPLKQYATNLCRQYPLAQDQVDKWYNVCKLQFPLYVDYWREHPSTKQTWPLLQERVFCVPYKLPSGRVVYLKGKWDAIDLEQGSPDHIGIRIQENKTKGQIEPLKMQRQLSFDLQTMIYVVALEAYREQLRKDMQRWLDEVIKEEPDNVRQSLADYDNLGDAGEYLIEPRVRLYGVRYNVIRRPLSGGKGMIVQHKPTKSNPQGETKESYYNRVRQYIIEEPDTYFMRWDIDITQGDIKNFCQKCLDPILEQLCIWYDIVCGKDVAIGPWQAKAMMHWRHPFGVFNPLDEGGSTDVDEYLTTGSEVGLTRVDNLFPELG